MDGFHLKVLIVDKLINFFRLQYHSFIAIFLVPSKIPEINSPSSGVLQTITSFLSNFIISIEVISSSLLSNGLARLIF